MKTKMFALLLAAGALGACAGGEETAQREDAAPEVSGQAMQVRSAMVPAVVEASGVAEPMAEATLSTKLMGTVTAVHVREGDRVSAGQVLVTIDARDLTAKSAQVAASVSEAEAMRREAATHAARMRTLYAEDAAPKAQLDAAETGLARAEAAVASARAAGAELGAVRDYSVVRAPFAGVVTRRMVDPGAFAAPGAPLVTVQDPARLRIRVTAGPEVVRGLTRGSTVAATVEGVPTQAVVEGVVPSAGSVYTVNAILDNRSGAYLPGSAATLALQTGSRQAIRVPAAAVRREGDLTGIFVKSGAATELRWVRVGATLDGQVEVLSGLRDGETIVVPSTVAAGGR